jgi:hypothetical protein
MWRSAMAHKPVERRGRKGRQGRNPGDDNKSTGKM